ncbi:MAG: CAP domain-containing protein [Kouleothrix sp.]
MVAHSPSDWPAVRPWEWPSESIAAGFDDPIQVVAVWMDEPPEGWHRRNILDTEQREIGAGYCYTSDDPSGNYHYWTADFAARPAEYNEVGVALLLPTSRRVTWPPYR